MIGQAIHIVSAASDIYHFRQEWDASLDTILMSPNLSAKARDHIIYENGITESGRVGFYLGRAIGQMNGNTQSDLVREVLSDYSAYFFAIRVVDDYFDQERGRVSFEERVERLDWEGIVDGSRETHFETPQEEASVYMLNEVLKRFDRADNFLQTMNDLYATLKIVESEDCCLEEKKQQDLKLSFLTLRPIFDLMENRGIEVDRNVYDAIRHLSYSARIWDHLGDLDKDHKHGDFNFVLEEAKLLAEGGRHPLIYIRRGVGKKAIAEAREHSRRGASLLDKEQKIPYNTLRILCTLKYAIEYYFNIYRNKLIYVFNTKL